MKKNPHQLLKQIQRLGYEVAQEAFRDQEQMNSGQFQYRYWRIPRENQKLVKTPFFFRGTPDFVHFTSLHALNSILNEGHLRLYNLLNMDDKFELQYAINELSFHPIEEEIDRAKRELYCLSMCQSKAILSDKLKEHLLWKLHGRDGHGVILRMSFENNLEEWCDFHLVKTFYDTSHFGAIKELNSQTDNEYLDYKMAAFLKLPIYAFEEEVRLVFDKRNAWLRWDKGSNLLHPIINPDKLDASDKISYYQLPITNLESDYLKSIPSNVLQSIPRLRIDEVILGYRLTEEQCKNIQTNFDFERIGATVRFTDLKQYY